MVTLSTGRPTPRPELRIFALIWIKTISAYLSYRTYFAVGNPVTLTFDFLIQIGKEALIVLTSGFSVRRESVASDCQQLPGITVYHCEKLKGLGQNINTPFSGIPKLNVAAKFRSGAYHWM